MVEQAAALGGEEQLLGVLGQLAELGARLDAQVQERDVGVTDAAAGHRHQKPGDP